MKRIFGFPKFGRWPKSKKEEQEFGPGKKDYVICPDCDAVYFEKSWHRSFESASIKTSEDKKISFQVCPADQMRRDGTFEGELTLKGVPAGEKKDLMNHLRNVAKQFEEKDPMDRVLKWEDKGATVRILTSENQLALTLGKAVHKASKSSSIDSSFSRAESPARVTVSWEHD